MASPELVTLQRYCSSEGAASPATSSAVGGGGAAAAEGSGGIPPAEPGGIAAGARTFRLRPTLPHGVRELELRLVPGRYALWCTLADHRARGMRATLVVRRA